MGLWKLIVVCNILGHLAGDFVFALIDLPKDNVCSTSDTPSLRRMHLVCDASSYICVQVPFTNLVTSSLFLLNHLQGWD